MNRDVKEIIGAHVVRAYPLVSPITGTLKGELDMIFYALDEAGLKIMITSKQDTIWDIFCKEIGSKLGLTSIEINNFLDGLGSYYDLDSPDHWIEMLRSISNWIEMTLLEKKTLKI